MVLEAPFIHCFHFACRTMENALESLVIHRVQVFVGDHYSNFDDIVLPDLQSRHLDDQWTHAFRDTSQSTQTKRGPQASIIHGCGACTAKRNALARGFGAWPPALQIQLISCVQLRNRRAPPSKRQAVWRHSLAGACWFLSTYWFESQTFPSTSRMAGRKNVMRAL